MENKQALTATAFYTSDWLRVLQEECKREAVENRQIPLINKKWRDILWKVCRILGFLKVLGVPGMACRLFERYLKACRDDYMKIQDDATRLRHIDEGRSGLTIACCVMLAAKMNTVDANKSVNFVRLSLLKNGLQYTSKEIKDAEFEIYKTLNFRIPLYTTVDMAEFLATKLGLSEQKVREAAVIADMADYFVKYIQDKINSDAAVSSVTTPICICSLHLAAASVTVAHDSDTVDAVASLVNVSSDYLRVIRDLLATRTAQYISASMELAISLKRNENLN